MGTMRSSWIPVCFALLLGAPMLRAADAPKEASAQLLDHADVLCVNCFLGRSDYFYCFAADNKILIGHRKTEVVNWSDGSKNYFTRLHPGSAAWAAPGPSIPISYDDKYIWVPAERGKKIKLTQIYSKDVFTERQCRDAVRSKTHE